MYKLLKILFVLFLLCGCMNKEKEQREDVELEMIEELTISSSMPLQNRYVIDDRFLKTAKSDLDRLEKLNYYMAISGNKEDFKIIEFYDNHLSVTAQGKDCPTIAIWQDEKGNLVYQFCLFYSYPFTYVKNGITKKARLTLSYSFGTGEFFRKNDMEIGADLQAGGNTYIIAYQGGEFFTNYDHKIGNKLEFTPDLHNKLVKIYEDFYANRFVESDGVLLEPIMEHIKNECPTIDVTDDYIYNKNGMAYFDYVAPLYKHDEIPYYHNNLTEYYVVGRDNLFGVINNEGKVVVPIKSTTIPELCENNEIHVMMDEACPNYTCEVRGTPYRYGREHGTAYFDYRREAAQLYQYTHRTNGPDVLAKIDLPNRIDMMPLIPYLAITNVSLKRDSFDNRNYLKGDSLNKHGLMDKEGKVIVEAKYDDIFAVSGNLIPVMRNGKWGYVNGEGKEVIPCDFEPVVRVPYGESKSDNYYDTDGNNRPNAVCGNYVVVKKNGLFGVLDLNGNTVIPFEYEAMSYYLNDSFIMRKGDKWYVQRIKESEEEVEMPELRVNKEKQSVNSYYNPTEEELNLILEEIGKLPFVSGKYVNSMTFKESKYRKFHYGDYDSNLLEIGFMEDDKKYALSVFEHYQRQEEYEKNGEVVNVEVTCSRLFDDSESLEDISVFVYDASVGSFHYDSVTKKYIDEIEEIEISEELKQVIESTYQEMKTLFLSEKKLAKVLSIVEKGMTSSSKSSKSSTDTSGYQFIKDLSFDYIQPLMNTTYNGVRYFEPVEDYFTFKKNEKFGLVNSNGIVVVEPKADKPFVLLDDYEIVNYYDENVFIPFTPYRYGGQRGLEFGNYYYDWNSNRVMQVSGGDDGPATFSYADTIPFPLARCKTFEYIKNNPHENRMNNVSEKYGIINSTGKLVVAPIYDDVVAYDSILLPVKLNGYWGYVNEMGEEVIPCVYQGIIQVDNRVLPYPVLEDKYVILKNKEHKYGVLDIQGNTILPFEYDLIASYLDHSITMKKDGKWTVQELEELSIYNEEKVTLEKCEDYDSVEPLLNIVEEPFYHYQPTDYYIVRKADLYGVINGKEELIVPIESTVKPSLNGANLFTSFSSEKDMRGEEQIPTAPFRYSGGYGIGYSYYLKSEEQIYQVLYGHDGPGTEHKVEKLTPIVDMPLIPFTSISNVHTVKNESNWEYLEYDTGKMGLMNSDGEVIVKPQYDDIFAVSGKLIPVKRNELWGYVNAEGKEIIPCVYQGIFTLYSELMPYPVMEDYYVILKNKNDKMGVKNILGEDMIPFEYDLIASYYDGKFVVIKNGEKSYIEVEEAYSENKN